MPQKKNFKFLKSRVLDSKLAVVARMQAVLADAAVQSILDVHVSRNQSPRHLLDLG